MRHSPSRLSWKDSSVSHSLLCPSSLLAGQGCGGGSAMASKRHMTPAKQSDSGGKKAKQGEEEDAWKSTLEALKTAPKEKPPATIDGLCPLSTEPDAQVRASLWGTQ